MVSLSTKFCPEFVVFQGTHTGLVMETSNSLINDMDAADEKAFSSLLENNAVDGSTKLTSEFAKELFMKNSKSRGDTLLVISQLFSKIFSFQMNMNSLHLKNTS